MFIFLLKLIIYVLVFFRKIELCLLLIMMKKFILFFLFPICIIAQDYNRGLQCFLAEDYVCAKKQFSFLQDHGERHLAEYSSYYMFLSALYLYHQDTEYLFEIKDKLTKMMIREKRIDIFKKCMKTIPTLVDMEISGYNLNIFEH